MTQVFLLTKAITAIRFNAQGRGSLCSLPVDAELRLTGDSGPAGFVEITYGNERYRIFRVDLTTRSVSLRTMSAAA